MKYIKYYNLEKYLFEEVGPKFRKTGIITVEDFFCIVIWKANRAKTNIKRKLSKTIPLSESIKKLTADLLKLSNKEERLESMLNIWGFGLPMATAILTVLYPKDFTVYDYRVRQQLGLNSIYSAKKYFNYFLPAVKEYSKKINLTLRETDKELWGKSFLEDLQRLIK